MESTARMRKTRIKTCDEIFYSPNLNRLKKLHNNDESPTRIKASCSVKHSEKETIYSADNPCLVLPSKIKLSNRCRALILSPLRLLRVFSERRQLYQLIISGEGSFGAVFRHVYNNRDVAIKQLYHCRHSSSSHFYSFCSELNAFRLPPSPYVVQAIALTSSGICLQVFFRFHSCHPDLLPDIFLASCYPIFAYGIVTEFIEGKNLQQLINDDMWHVNFSQRLQLAFQVISGLVHCHDHLLLHLDVKPANIIVHANGKICKLSDFGCSRTATTSQNGLLIAGEEIANTGFGTITYKAPELLKGQTITDRADIYSFSLVLWETLTQETVYSCMHPHIFIYGVVARKLRPKLELLDLPKNKHSRTLITLLENCWSDELTKRPSAILVQQIIKQFISNKKLILS